MYRTVVTICTAQWSIYVPPLVTVCTPLVIICTAQWSLYVPPLVFYMYRHWSLYVPHSGHYMYRHWSLYVPHSGHCMYRKVVTIPHSGHYMCRTSVTVCTAQWSLYVPPVVTICTASLTFNNSTFCPHTHCIYMFCVDLRTNSHYFSIQH